MKKQEITIQSSILAGFMLWSQREILLNLSPDLSRSNISFAQFYIMGFLDSSRELTMTDIARKMGHSTAASTGLVDRLQDLGYVTREHSSDDRRKVIVRITLKGLELIAKIRTMMQDRIAQVMTDVGSSDLSALMSPNS